MDSNKKPLRRLIHVIVAAGITGLVVLLLYLIAIRPWQARWGATDAEAGMTLPGDSLVLAPENQTTRAITINAPAASVWPWLVQMGQGRGGLYSYEMLENLIGCDMHNADRIVPEWQTIAIGDRVRMYPEGSGPPPYTIAEIYEGQALVTGHSADPGGVPLTVSEQTKWTDTWAFVLIPDNQKSTRLIIRSRSAYADPTMSAIMSMVEPGYFIMERGMLTGIKERAERVVQQTSGQESSMAASTSASDGWSVALLVTALAGLSAFLFIGPWPHKLYVLPLSAAIWAMVLFFGYPSPVLALVALLAALAVLFLSVIQPIRKSTGR